MFTSPLVVEFIRGTHDAILLEDLVWKDKIVVKKGFVTDFASVPNDVILQGIVPRNGRERAAAVLHDWIYRGHEPSYTRKMADDLFLEAMKSVGFPLWRAYIAYLAVRIFGGIAWKEGHKK